MTLEEKLIETEMEMIRLIGQCSRVGHLDDAKNASVALKNVSEYANGIFKKNWFTNEGLLARKAANDKIEKENE